MAEENHYSEFVRNIGKLLQNGCATEALDIIKNSEHAVEVRNNCWDLIPMIAKFLTDTQEKNNFETFSCCRELIDLVSEKSNAEEVLLQLIEEIEDAEDDTKFFTLLKPVQKVIVRIPKKRINSIAWCFNAIHVYLNKSEIPDNENLIAKEKLLFDCNESTQKITKQYYEIIKFYDEFTKKLADTNVENAEEQSLVVRKFLIQLLGKPLMFLDMEAFGGVKNKARLLAERIVQKILFIKRDPIALLSIQKDSDLLKPDTVSLAVFFYLIYAEDICNEQVPKVYHPYYFFQNSLYLCTELLNTDHQIVVEKGLFLANRLLLHVNHHKLPYLMLDAEHHCRFCRSLSSVIVYNQSEEIRKRALNIYRSYVLNFEIHGFYLVVYNLMSILHHAGLIGFTITLYKDVLVSEFSKEKISPFFRDYKLFAILNKFCYLPQQEASDLIVLSDQIIASLNLLRYLTLRDQNNVTGIWNHISVLDESFLKPLRKGIDLSRAHYELKIKEIREETASGDKKDSESKISVAVGGQRLEDMPFSEKLKVISSSLTAFDMMESLLTRLNECIESNTFSV